VKSSPASPCVPTWIALTVTGALKLNVMAAVFALAPIATAPKSAVCTGIVCAAHTRGETLAASSINTAANGVPIRRNCNKERMLTADWNASRLRRNGIGSPQKLLPNTPRAANAATG
jgi:hypothetical protein